MIVMAALIYFLTNPTPTQLWFEMEFVKSASFFWSNTSAWSNLSAKCFRITFQIIDILKMCHECQHRSGERLKKILRNIKNE